MSAEHSIELLFMAEVFMPHIRQFTEKINMFLDFSVNWENMSGGAVPIPTFDFSREDSIVLPARLAQLVIDSIPPIKENASKSGYAILKSRKEAIIFFHFMRIYSSNRGFTNLNVATGIVPSVVIFSAIRMMEDLIDFKGLENSVENPTALVGEFYIRCQCFSLMRDILGFFVHQNKAEIKSKMAARLSGIFYDFRIIGSKLEMNPTSMKPGYILLDALVKEGLKVTIHPDFDEVKSQEKYDPAAVALAIENEMSASQPKAKPKAKAKPSGITTKLTSVPAPLSLTHSKKPVTVLKQPEIVVRQVLKKPAPQQTVAQILKSCRPRIEHESFEPARRVQATKLTKAQTATTEVYCVRRARRVQVPRLSISSLPSCSASMSSTRSSSMSSVRNERPAMRSGPSPVCATYESYSSSESSFDRPMLPTRQVFHWNPYNIERNKVEYSIYVGQETMLVY